MRLDELFDQAAEQEGGFVRASVTHAADLFVGIEGGARALMLRCPDLPQQLPHLASLAIERRQRYNGWTLLVKLQRAELRGLFNHLAEDLIASVLSADAADAADVMVARLVRWQRLLAGARSGLLEDDQLRGLAAELDFLVHHAAPRYGAAESVGAWGGPLAAPKDFSFADVEIEVKATHRNSKRLKISSIEQLSAADRPIYLWTRVVELVTQPGPGLTNLSELVEATRLLVAHHPTAWEILELKLHAGGYADSPDYNDRWMKFGESKCYAVGPAFPRMERSTTPAGIVDGEYTLDIPSLAAFVVPSWTAGG